MIPAQRRQPSILDSLQDKRISPQGLFAGFWRMARPLAADRLIPTSLLPNRACSARRGAPWRDPMT